MKVIHLLRKLDASEWSGTEVATHRLFEGLRQHGVKPVAYCPRVDGDGEDPLSTSGFEVQRFKAFVPVLGLSRTRKKQLVSVGGNLMSFGLIPALWRERGFSIVHTHTLGRLGGIALTLAKQRRVPFVVSIHGGVLDLPDELKPAFNSPPDRGWEWGRVFGLLFQSRRLFKDADAILTCNEREAGLIRSTLPGKRVLVQPHGVPTELYRQDQREAARTAFPEIRNRQMLLCVGRIDPVKNQGWLVEQAPRIFQKHPRALLVLAGPCTDEPYGAKVRKRILELGVADRVIMTGGLASSDPRLIGLIQSADLLLLPSISETFGLVLLEAWAAGTPVLSTNASGPSALVRPGDNGWLFDLKDPDGFHRALDWTLANPDAARAMAARGAEVSDRFSVRALAGAMKSMYENLIEEKNALRDYP